MTSKYTYYMEKGHGKLREAIRSTCLISLNLQIDLCLLPMRKELSTCETGRKSEDKNPLIPSQRSISI